MKNLISHVLRRGGGRAQTLTPLVNSIGVMQPAVKMLLMADDKHAAKSPE